MKLDINAVNVKNVFPDSEVEKKSTSKKIQYGLFYWQRIWGN